MWGDMFGRNVWAVRMMAKKSTGCKKEQTRKHGGMAADEEQIKQIKTWNRFQMRLAEQADFEKWRHGGKKEARLSRERVKKGQLLMENNPRKGRKLRKKRQKWTAEKSEIRVKYVRAHPCNWLIFSVLLKDTSPSDYSVQGRSPSTSQEMTTAYWEW